jgi:multidrug efflux system outer membrane protein
MRFFRIFFILFIASCNLAPRYERPEMEIGQSYRFDFHDTSSYANVSWWKQLNDPILDDLIQTALNNNQDLKIATARVMEFYDRYKVVFSQFFPELDAVANYDRIKLSEEINYLPTSPLVPRINNLYSLFLKMSYELDFWGRIRNESEAAKSNYLAQVDTRRNVILALVTSVASAYIQLKQLDAQLQISISTYRSRLEAWKIARLRFEGGIVSELDVKQAETEALIAELQIKNFEAFVAKQEDLISVLLGQAPGPIARGGLLAEMTLPPTIPAGLPADLLENRPDIMQAEERIIAANAEVGVARSAFFPKITLSGVDGQRSTSIGNFLKDSANLFDFGMQAFEPLFTGWRLSYQLKAGEAVLLEAIYNYQQTILTALQEVSDALVDHQKSKEKIGIQRERVAALQEYLRLARLRYFNGQNDYLTVLNAENGLFLAQLEEVNTEADLYLSLVSIYKALGQGWDVTECNSCPEEEG